MTPDESTAPYLFGDLLALARQEWARRMAADVATLGFPGYRRSDAVLTRVLARGPRSLGELGSVLGTTRQAARKVVDGLHGRGFVEEGRDPHDARRTAVRLTASGEAYAAAVLATVHDLNRELATRVPAADLAAADAVLRACLGTGPARHRADRLVDPPGPGPRPRPGAG